MIVTLRPLHNQSIADDDTFVARFVARRTTLDALLRRLRAADDEQIDLHRILIGPRGMGKTSLLRRTAIAINRAPDLAERYVPLTFREEQYNVRRLGDFWRNCGEALAEWAEANGRDALARRIDRELAGHAWAGDLAGESFTAEIRALERRAVLLVDNLDLILDALNQPNDSDNWTLRGFLQQPGGPILIGAATKPLSQSVAREAAFYEFFMPDYLNPLDAAETEACMRALAAANGENGNRVLATLNSQPERLKTLHTLTGGNPRVLALIYRLLETDETGAAMDDLALLLDQVTPYYKARIEEYTPAQRAILDGIALHWDPITIAQLSRETGIPTTTLSGQITRMINKDNVLEAVETSGSYSGYQFVERFFNIWYLMRHGTRRTKQKMRWLVEFLTSFYSAAELNDLARRAKMKGIDRHWAPEYSEAISEALSRCAVEKPELAGPVDQPAKIDVSIRNVMRRAAAARQSGDNASAISLYEEVLERIGSDAALQPLIPPVLYNRAIALRQMGQNDEALASYDRMIALIEPAESNQEQRLIAQALLNKSVIVGLLRGPDEERKILDMLIARFDSDPDRQEAIVRALLNRALVAQRMADYQSALSDYETVAERFGNTTDPNIAERVARALFSKAMLLSEQASFSESIAAFDVVRNYARDNLSDISLRLTVGPLFYQAIMLGQSNDQDAAIKNFNSVISLLEGHDTEESRSFLITSLFNKSTILMDKGRIDEAKLGYEHILAEFKDRDEPNTCTIMAHTLLNLAQISDIENDRKAELAYYDSLLAQFSESSIPDMQPIIAQAMMNRALVIDEQSDKEPVVLAYDAIIARFGDTNEVIQRELTVGAMLNRAIALGEAKRYDEALTAFDALIERFGKDANPRLRRDAAQGLYSKAITYHLLDDVAEERATYRTVLKLYGGDFSPELDEPVVSAALHLGIDLEQQGELREAIAIYDSVSARFSDRPDLPDLAELTKLQVRFALLLADVGIDSARAETLLRGIEVREPVVGRVNRAWLALLRGDAAEAAALAEALDGPADVERALLTAGVELTRGNFGLASEHLSIALDRSTSEGRFVFSENYIRLLRVAVDSGFGDRMLEWFEETGFAERLAPLYVAFRALVRGEATLRDASPEVSEPAGVILDRLLRRRAGSAGIAGGAPRERSGRKPGRTEQG